MAMPLVRRNWDRPRRDMKEWDECVAATAGKPKRLTYALWMMLWHWDSECKFGAMLAETRRVGYDGELV